LQDVLRSPGAKRQEMFVGVVISEISGSNAGVGHLQTSASAGFNYALVFGGLLILSALDILLYAMFAVLERRLTGWAYRGKSQPTLERNLKNTVRYGLS
jgi:ABC-type microcin C transport system permease subunit YejB